jgi:hypothetical protein
MEEMEFRWDKKELAITVLSLEYWEILVIVTGKREINCED